MDPIEDYTWLRQMLTGTVIERFHVGAFHAVGLRLSQQKGGDATPFRFRILLFCEGVQQPVAAYNLELSILGSDCLTEQVGHLHRNLGHASEEMSYPQFKAWAVEQARNLTQ
ncbi:MAG TPA: hypothetical protein VMV68_04775 [Spirochaetia bacterium]|nr:hypothetical protein [Spirochaetia bacterium]